jgi:Beta-lactamase
MGRLVVNNAMTVNGAFEAPSPEPDGWLVLDPDSNQVSLEQFLVADAMVLGSRTYQGLAGVWPKLADDPALGVFAARMNRMPKYVASRTLRAPLEWNATLLEGELADSVADLKPDTLASMFQPHFQPDPRVPGMGLGFEPGEESGHATVGKTGVVVGFLSAMMLAPDDGIGVVVFTNTGGLDGRGVAEPLAVALLRRLLGLPDAVIRADIPVRPEVWREVCGWYSPDAGPVTNLFLRALMGAGAEVTVHDGQLLLKPLTPIPAMRRGLRLYPDDPDDPWVFRIKFPNYGKSSRVVFSRGPEDRGAPMRLLLDVMSLQKRPEVRNPRRWVNGVLAAGAAALAIRRGLHRRVSA